MHVPYPIYSIMLESPPDIDDPVG